MPRRAPALRHVWYGLTGSYWFIPALVVTAAVLLALFMVEVDDRFVDSDRLKDWPRLFAAGDEASRQLLAAIATSMITVAGTVFSITLVALSLASSQYSPRVLRSFMRDRANQAVLGSFVGIHAYCLVVLRTIHDRDDQQFVPAVSVLVGLVLGFVGIAVLVFFIHHIARRVQASTILAAVHVETMEAIDRLFPHSLASALDPCSTGAAPDRDWPQIGAHRSGYLQQIDFARLRDLLSDCDGAVHIDRRVGDYVIEGDLIACHRPLDGGRDGRMAERIRACWTIGSQRTLEQDVAFGLRQLVDVALKALSPSSNDTTTATMCLDHLTALLVRLSDRHLVYANCSDHGQERVMPRHPDFGELVACAYGQILEHSRGNIAVLEHLLVSLQRLHERTHDAARRQLLRARVSGIVQALAHVDDDDARARIHARAEALLVAG